MTSTKAQADCHAQARTTPPLQKAQERGTLTSCGGLTEHGEGRATRPRYWGTAATILAVRLPLVTGQLKIHFCSEIQFSTTGVRSGAIPLVFTAGGSAPLQSATEIARAIN